MASGLDVLIGDFLPENMSEAAKKEILTVMNKLVENVFRGPVTEYQYDDMRNMFKDQLTLGLFKEQDSQNFSYMILNSGININESFQKIIEVKGENLVNPSDITKNAKIYFLNAIYLTVNALVQFGQNTWEVYTGENRPDELDVTHFSDLLTPWKSLLGLLE